MSQAQSAATKQTVGTVTGFKVAMVSLIGLVVAALVLQEVVLVYMMVMVPAVVGLLTGTVVGGLDIAAGDDRVGLPVVLGVAAVVDVLAVVAVVFLL